jgi:putative DNA primase/helicase
MESNHKPEIRGTDPAIWNRIRLVPFAVDVPAALGDQCRPAWQVEEQLVKEMHGVLAWAVRGLQLYLQEGLGAPPAVADATAEYREESDDVAAWIRDCCIVGKAYYGTSKNLYASWKEWANENGAYCISQKKFAQKLKEKGCRPDTMGSGRDCNRIWYGVGLLVKDSTATDATDATHRQNSWEASSGPGYSSATDATDATDYPTRAYASEHDDTRAGEQEVLF